MKERLAQRCPVCFRATDTSICGECASLLADVVPEGIELMPLPDDCVSAELAGKIRRLIMPHEPFHDWDHQDGEPAAGAGERWVCKNCNLTISMPPEDPEWRLETGANACGARQVKIVMEC